MVYRWRIRPRRAVEYMSPAVERITGRPAEDFYANPSLGVDLVVEEDRAVMQSLIDNPSGHSGPLSVRWRHADGTIVWTEILRTPIRDKAGVVVAVEGILRDVTREKAMERERDAHAALLAALIANMQDGVMAENETGRITVVNAAFSRIFNLPPPATLIGQSALGLREQLWAQLVSDPEAYRRLTSDLRRERRPQLGFEVHLKDGRVLDRDYVPVPAPGSSVVHMWHYRDVTQRRQLENRLRESRRRLRDLSAHAETTREAERRELARTLHDELGQLFSSIRLELGAAIVRFRESPSPAMRSVVDRLQAAAGLTDIGMASLRRMTTSLRPPVLDHLGLVAAIRWEASIFSKRTGIRCHVRARPSAMAVHDPQVTALYRILLSALDNIARHAAAGTAWISLTRRRGLTLMEIRDNGRGITDEEINNPRTMGLLGMRERAIAAGGEMEISGARRRGTRVFVTLPHTDPRSPTPPRKRRRRAISHA